MKCKKCKYDNIIKASYCQKCGEKFTEKERTKAYDKTIYGKLDKIKKIKDIATLDIVTGHIAFKILSLLIVLGIGFFFLFKMGIDTKILNSKDYQIFYNKDSKEYYLIVDDSYDKVDVSLYRPNRIKEMKLYHHNTDDTLIEETKLDSTDDISLTTYKDDYYIIESTYSNKKTDKLKILVYHQSDI